MLYTVRYAHLKQANVAENATLNMGEKIADYGKTGVGTGPHLHIDCVEGLVTSCWKLSDTETGIRKSAHRQLNWFIDNDLFKCRPVITTWYNDYTYFLTYHKVHLAYDIVPQPSTNTSIYWNRSMVGTVRKVGTDPAYGNFVLVSFNA